VRSDDIFGQVAAVQLCFDLERDQLVSERASAGLDLQVLV
jgi:hypothetical protein